jgi:serine/threonine-protein kinase
MDLPADATASYHAPGPFRPARLDGAAAGDSAEPSQELRLLLRRCLTAIGLNSLAVSGAVAIIVTPLHAGNRDWEALAFFWAIVAIPAVELPVVRSRWANSLARLRAAELTILGLATALDVFDAHRMLVRNHEAALFAVYGQLVVNFPSVLRAGEIRMVTVLAGRNSLYWVALLIGYGLIIPNTRRRAAVVVGTLAVIHVLVHGTFVLTDPHLRTTNVLWYMPVIVGSMAVAAATVVAGVSRFESLRREAQAARRVGQYRLMELLGVGGMGEVYRAEHLMLRRPCAVKLIRPERAGDPENLRRFEREVRATATLTNWHTVEVYDYGHAADGTFYYAMEYLPGLTVDQLVAQHGPVPPERAVHLLRQVCVALREAHAIGLVHRDIKPGNVIVGQRGGIADVAKLLDFGLVRAERAGAAGDTATGAGVLVGTPAYMAPEQAGGEPVDARTDIYSLGAVAYFLLAGRPAAVRRQVGRPGDGRPPTGRGAALPRLGGQRSRRPRGRRPTVPGEESRPEAPVGRRTG